MAYIATVVFYLENLTVLNVYQILSSKRNERADWKIRNFI